MNHPGPELTCDSARSLRSDESLQTEVALNDAMIASSARLRRRGAGLALALTGWCMCAALDAAGAVQLRAIASRPRLLPPLLPLRLRGGGLPQRLPTKGGQAQPVEADSGSGSEYFDEVDLEDSQRDGGDVDLQDLLHRDPLDGEFVQARGDAIDEDFEPFLGDSDFMEEDGWDLAGAREYRPGSPLTTDAGDDDARAQLVVPDMLESLPAAVRAAELAQRDAQQVPLLFVRGGEYRWRETIVLIEKHELDVPPFSVLAPHLINNSSTHWKYESPVPAALTLNTSVVRVRLRLTGDTGALLWGSWHLGRGSSASLSMVQVRTRVRVTLGARAAPAPQLPVPSPPLPPRLPSRP